MDQGTPELLDIALMTGPEIMEAVRDGKPPRAPIAEIANMHGTEVEEGRVILNGTP